MDLVANLLLNNLLCCALLLIRTLFFPATTAVAAAAAGEERSGATSLVEESATHNVNHSQVSDRHQVHFLIPCECHAADPIVRLHRTFPPSQLLSLLLCSSSSFSLSLMTSRLSLDSRQLTCEPPTRVSLPLTACYSGCSSGDQMTTSRRCFSSSLTHTA